MILSPGCLSDVLLLGLFYSHRVMMPQRRIEFILSPFLPGNYISQHIGTGDLFIREDNQSFYYIA